MVNKKKSKKKTIKKGKKSRPRKKINKDISLRKDFEVFSKGIQRLEELKAELNNLNTSGYEAEANSIRSKLKNVSYIPQIEKEIRILKTKIRGTYKKKESKKHFNDPHKKIHRKIRELESEIKKRKNMGSKRQLSKEEVVSVKDIPKIENQVSFLRSFLKRKQEEEKKKKELLKKIDPEIDLLVNDKFNLTLGEIKVELSKGVKDKESQIQKRLQEDLELRKKNFGERYKNLEKKFSEKYTNKVKSSLNKEIARKFNEALQKRVSQESEKKIKISKEKFRKLKESLRKEFESKKISNKILQKKVAQESEKKIKGLSREEVRKLKENLRKEFESKKAKLEKEYKNKLLKDKENLRKHSNEEILVHRAKLGSKMNRHLTDEIKKLHKTFDIRKKEHEQRINQIKNNLENKTGLLSKIRNKLNAETRKIKEDEENYKRELSKKMENEKAASIKKTLAEKSAKMKNQLGKEFKDKLKLEIKSKEAEFEKKKADLTLEIQNKAKQIFG